VRAILTFHSVDPSGSVLSIAPDELRSLIGSIRASGHRIVALGEMLAEPATPRRIALTFDDGVASLHEHALPLLGELAVPATLFLTTGWLGRDNRWPGMPADAPHMTMLDWEQVGELHAAGWSIQAHTVNHPDMRTLEDVEIDRELESCDREIEARLGVRPDVFAYPYGHYDARVAARASRRYRHAVTAAMGTLPESIEDPMHVPRLETYYFRSPSIHRRFDGTFFRAYLAGRSVLRRLRHAG
jgi:peptidoglycan/xylan/chitin deacetylase (PgdA/CDA1 family)